MSPSESEAADASAIASISAIAEFVWLGERLEQVFPKAREFVRHGFDEPDAVAQLG